MKLKKQSGGHIFGKGGNGMVLGIPPLLFLKKFTMNCTIAENGKIILNSRNNVVEPENLELLMSGDYDNVVSKIFKTPQQFMQELKSYIIILKVYELNKHPELFNLPLNWGTINYELVDSTNQIYNARWLGKSNLSGRTISSILLSNFKCKEQITFTVGLPVLDISFDDFFDKYSAVFNIIKFLNDYSLLYDDLKLDNLLVVEGVIKLCDFSSIISAKDLNLEIFDSTNLSNTFYPIYNPILISMLNFFLLKKHGDSRENNVIISELCEGLIQKSKNNLYKNEIEQKEIRLINILIPFIQRQQLNIENINLKNSVNLKNTENARIEITKSNQKLNFKNILEIINSYSKITNPVEYFAYLWHFMILLSIKHHGRIEEIIVELFMRIHCFATGYMIFDFIATKIEEEGEGINIQKFKKLILIAIGCCLQMYKIDSKIYFLTPNIDHMNNYYQNSSHRIEKKRNRNNNELNKNNEKLPKKISRPNSI